MTHGLDLDLGAIREDEPSALVVTVKLYSLVKILNGQRRQLRAGLSR
ncbi:MULTISPECIES: hypothetical protein [unclassified Salinibacterium]|nr:MULTISPECIES: hypothetical protein [unclassified Salinibacterium]